MSVSMNDMDIIRKSLKSTAQQAGCIEFEGIRLPPLLRPKGVEDTFAIGHGALYGHLTAGRIRSIAVKGNPGQRRCTRLVYTQSVIDFLRSCEAQEGVRP